MPRSRASRSRRARVGPARTVSRWPVWQWSRRILLGLLAAPLALQIVLGAVAVLLVWLTVNWVYQVIRKPTEVFFPGADIVRGVIFLALTIGTYVIKLVCIRAHYELSPLRALAVLVLPYAGVLAIAAGIFGALGVTVLTSLFG